MSSPATAVATLTRQANKSTTDSVLTDLDEDLMSAYVYDPTDQEQAVDASPTVVLEQGQATYSDTDKRKFRTFIQAAGKLRGEKDQKLQACIVYAEECAVVGFTGSPTNPIWLTPEQAKALLEEANPVSDVPFGIKKQEIEELLHRMDELTTDLEKFALEPLHQLSQSHRRVRAITQEGAIRVTPQLPMDLLGIYILQPGKPKNSSFVVAL